MRVSRIAVVGLCPHGRGHPHIITPDDWCYGPGMTEVGLEQVGHELVALSRRWWKSGVLTDPEPDSRDQEEMVTKFITALLEGSR